MCFEEVRDELWCIYLCNEKRAQSSKDAELMIAVGDIYQRLGDILDCEERTPSYDIWHACELLEVMKRQLRLHSLMLPIMNNMLYKDCKEFVEYVSL